MKNILVSGGAGFIGSNFVLYMLEKYPDYHIVVFDKLTYAGNLDNLLEVSDEPRYRFVRGDICDSKAVEAALRDFSIDAIINFAAETHVDRSIIDPDAFMQTNVYGTYVLLEAAHRLGGLRYHQVSTDEVYGDVPAGSASIETDPLIPRSPYAASKASGDLMTLAYHTTYKLPVTVTRGANNIGPYQYPEKVVPLFATNAIDNEPLPMYGDGRQMRDYQYVGDHCRALDIVLHNGAIGEIYNVGTGDEMENLSMVEILLDELSDLVRRQPMRELVRVGVVPIDDQVVEVVRRKRVPKVQMWHSRFVPQLRQLPVNVHEFVRFLEFEERNGHHQERSAVSGHRLAQPGQSADLVLPPTVPIGFCQQVVIPC